MNIIVVGCGRIGSELAYNLYKRDHKVVVIDTNGNAFANLPPDFRGRTVEGDVLSPDVLERAGILQAHALAAVTPDDSVNAVAAHTARVVYKVPNVAVRAYEPNKRRMHEIFGLQVISPSAWGAQRIEELLSTDALRTVFSAGNGEVELYEFSAPPAWDGKRLNEVLALSDLRVVSVTQAGKARLPTADDRIRTGDVVLLSAVPTAIADLQARLTRARGA